MKSLDDLMRSIRDMADDAPHDAAPADLLLYAPCPVKLAMKDGVDALATARQARGERLSVHIPMGCTSVDPYDPLHMETDPDRLPAVIASIGFGDFWRKTFVERFVDPGVFTACPPQVLSPLHRDAGLPDPRGHYTIYGVTPYIFLVDTRALGGLPVPGCWEDLLHPRYRGKILMCGDGDDMADAVLLSLYKDFGLDGMAAFAANVRGLAHSSAMAKDAGGSGPDAGAISIIPCFFAQSIRQPAHIRTVWPRDGAAASPLYFLAKTSERERLADVTAFFSTGFSAIPSAAWFAPMDGSRPSALPEDARLKWVGWDYVRQNDLNTLRDTLYREFRAMRAAAQAEGA